MRADALLEDVRAAFPITPMPAQTLQEATLADVELPLSNRTGRGLIAADELTG